MVIIGIVLGMFVKDVNTVPMDGDCMAAILLPTCSNGIGGVSMLMAFLGNGGRYCSGVVAFWRFKNADVLSGLDLYWLVIFVTLY